LQKSFRHQQLGPCAVRGCQLPIRARGLCWACYQRLRWHGKLSMQWRPAVANPGMPGTMLIPISKGMNAIIDACDADVVSQWRWSARVNGRNVYAQRIDHGHKIDLHRFLWRHWGMPETPEIDHENGNGLDCRRENLRPATHMQNMWNMRLSAANTSGVKGVHFDKSRGKWAADIRAGETRLRLGRFDSIEDAAAAYRAAAERLHGEFARAA